MGTSNPAVRIPPPLRRCRLSLTRLPIVVGSWGFRFALECVAEVATRTLNAQGPKYSEILELDRKIREFAIPGKAMAMLKGPPGADPKSIPLSASMTHFVLNHTRETSMFPPSFLHHTQKYRHAC